MGAAEAKEATEDAIRRTIRSRADREEIRRLVEHAQDGYIVTISPPTASDELTARLHCAIRCVAKQVKWAGEKLGEEDWKRLLVAGLFGQRVVPSPIGHGFVVLDRRTSRMSSMTKHELLEFVYSFGAEHGVEFDD